jgi:hypothetical protein
MKLTKILTLLMLFAVGGIVSISPEAYGTSLSVGDSIRIDYPPPAYSRFSNGGPFQITDLTTPTGSFITFCVETNEYFTPGGTYFVGGISSSAIEGGVAGGSPDSLDPRTAYLYYNFIKSGSPLANSNDLQQIIWYIEDEYSGSLTADALAMLADANAHAGNSLWGVQVINIYNSAGGGNAQDMLVYVPEPGILILLGIALSVVGLASRRFKF